jgi:serine/threonine protein kinase
MGEVWRATDMTLWRPVAIEVLPDAFAQDAERFARFECKVKPLAALNHPNIATILSLEDTGSTLALVIEPVAEPTLADSIARGPLPLTKHSPSVDKPWFDSYGSIGGGACKSALPCTGLSSWISHFSLYSKRIGPSGSGRTQT